MTAWTGITNISVSIVFCDMTEITVRCHWNFPSFTNVFNKPLRNLWKAEEVFEWIFFLFSTLAKLMSAAYYKTEGAFFACFQLKSI